jgi:pimeloyl-ACP methyl ester carboxylesterase
VSRTTRPPQVPAAVFAKVSYFLPRLLFRNARHAPQAQWGDIALALDGFPDIELDLGSAAFWDEWRTRWTTVADGHRSRALAAGTLAGRCRALRSAAACYHWAEFMDFDDQTRKLALRSSVRECFLESLELGDLPVTQGSVTVDGQQVPYWLLVPGGHGTSVPCVVLCNGLDSMTEVEMLSIAESYLDRGIAALLFEGPGQGLSIGQVPLRTDIEAVVTALVDELAVEPRIAADRLGFVGISFGGYFALRVAHRMDGVFRGVVNYSGGPEVANFTGLPRRLRDDFRFVLGVDPLGVQEQLDALALTGGGPARTRVISVHGALDDIFPLAALCDLDLRWGEWHRLIVHDREAHVCLNLLAAVTEDSADWLAAILREIC